MLLNDATYRAKSFLDERNMSSMAFEVKRTRAVWDESLAIPGTNRRGGWRCPPGTRWGGEITDRFGRNCGWGVARRLANELNDLGERLESIGDRRRGRRLERRNRRMVEGLAREGRQVGRLERVAGRVAQALESDKQPSPKPATEARAVEARVARRRGGIPVRRGVRGNLRASEERRMRREIDQPGAPRTDRAERRPVERVRPPAPRARRRTATVNNAQNKPAAQDNRRQWMNSDILLEKVRDAVDPRDQNGRDAKQRFANLSDEQLINNFLRRKFTGQRQMLAEIELVRRGYDWGRRPDIDNNGKPTPNAIRVEPTKAVAKRVPVKKAVAKKRVAAKKAAAKRSAARADEFAKREEALPMRMVGDVEGAAARLRQQDKNIFNRDLANMWVQHFDNELGRLENLDDDQILDLGNNIRRRVADHRRNVQEIRKAWVDIEKYHEQRLGKVPKPSPTRPREPRVMVIVDGKVNPRQLAEQRPVEGLVLNGERILGRNIYEERKAFNKRVHLLQDDEIDRNVRMLNGLIGMLDGLDDDLILDFEGARVRAHNRMQDYENIPVGNARRRLQEHVEWFNAELKQRQQIRKRMAAEAAGAPKVPSAPSVEIPKTPEKAADIVGADALKRAKAKVAGAIAKHQGRLAEYLDERYGENNAPWLDMDTARFRMLAAEIQNRGSNAEQAAETLKKWVEDMFTHQEIKGANGETYRIVGNARVVRGMGGPHMHFSGSIQKKVGDRWYEVGTTSRTLQTPGADPEKWHWYNSTMFIRNEADKGAGIATIYNHHAFMYQKAAGFKGVKVSAAQDGPYVWGRFGYRHEIRSNAVDAARREVERFRNEGGRRGVIRSEEQAQIWEALIRQHEAWVAGGMRGQQEYRHMDFIYAIDIANKTHRNAVKAWFKRNMPFYSGEFLFDENGVVDDPRRLRK